MPRTLSRKMKEIGERGARPEGGPAGGLASA